MINFEEQFNNIEIKNINDFENEFNLQLPESYKQFLLTHNGGYAPEKDCFSIGKENTTLQTFFGLNLPKKEKADDLKRCRYFYEDSFDQNFIAIARDCGGDLILLNLDNESVYFLDNQNIIFITDSFNNFISNKLYE